jgi:RNA polymerase sigma-70 factor (ECF subfamily)
MDVVQPPAPDSSSDVAEGRLAITDFVECYQVHYRRLVRALRLSGADSSTAEDVAQEAFARALVHWRRVRRGANPAGYVYITGFRLLQRAQRRSSLTSPDRAGEVSSPPPSGASPSAGGPEPTESAALMAVTVEAALAAMPPRRRACAVLCLVTGLPVAEAASALSIAEGTVRKHLEEARRDLRQACVPPS